MSDTDQDTDTAAPEAEAAAPGPLGMLANIKVRMTVEVGRTQITIQELLKLSEGSVVELDRMAGDPLDILVNGTPIAKGEVVVVGEKFGIRFGDIVDPKERMDSV
ncbi:flagellar motor switch protein FliN [Pseudoprimorskyibacter insulae]|uniref:Flagellar motor switch protein FliN n=1 Tax=Pseudoprimorskyibacter insulae TaxID=1695997 RepID=A0A2R8AVN9_9RHOB|nr:Flagellar motor switch protein FliN [Pseudoprimorskyibacter insulae]